MERYKDQPFDAIKLLERLKPWPPNLIEMTYEPNGVIPTYIAYENDWDPNSTLTELQSIQGYKLKYEGETDLASIRLEGAKEDYDTKIEQLVTGENWVGYFLDKSLYPEQCLPPGLWEALVQIKTQYWTMTKVASDPPWYLQGKKTPFKYGDLVILKTSHPYPGFQWQNQSAGTTDTEIPQTTYYAYEEQQDYLPFYIETDSTSEIMEIALFADGVVRGAAVREPGDTLVEVRGYLEGVSPGALIEFETWNGYKSQPVEKGNYLVIDHRRKVREKRNIYTGEKANYYHVSLKSNEVFEIPPEIGLVTCQPNPFRQNVEFSFRLNKTADLSIQIYEMQGNPIKTIINGSYPEGSYSFTWEGDNEAGYRINPGVYFYKVSTGNETLQTDKIVMIK